MKIYDFTWDYEMHWPRSESRGKVVLFLPSRLCQDIRKPEYVKGVQLAHAYAGVEPYGDLGKMPNDEVLAFLEDQEFDWAFGVAYFDGCRILLEANDACLVVLRFPEVVNKGALE